MALQEHRRSSILERCKYSLWLKNNWGLVLYIGRYLKSFGVYLNFKSTCAIRLPMHKAQMKDYSTSCIHTQGGRGSLWSAGCINDISMHPRWILSSQKERKKVCILLLCIILPAIVVCQVLLKARLIPSSTSENTNQWIALSRKWRPSLSPRKEYILRTKCHSVE